MQNLQLNWEQGAALGLALIGIRAATKGIEWTPLARIRPYLLESAIIAGLYALWQLAASQSVLGTAGAFDRARWIERSQRDWGLPSERSLQKFVLGHPLVAQACNWFYASAHFTALGALLVWLFVRHRDRYPRVRTVLVLLTASCLLIQLIPVAPPRLLPSLGFIDVAEQYGQSVYGIGGITVDQLGAMPSVHVGWALLIGWAVITASPSRWRWVVLAHPLITIFVVAATGNHFWLDGIVAGALLAISVGVVELTMRLYHRYAGSEVVIHHDEGIGDLVQADSPAY